MPVRQPFDRVRVARWQAVDERLERIRDLDAER
jgi:hypothetical protein